MMDGQCAGGAPRRCTARGRSALTLVEMLVVVAIITMLVALLFPAMVSARRSARSATCQSNLRQFGVGLTARAMKKGAFCSGAFDWRHDGSVTDAGWVADLVNTGIPVGKMLCPSNTAQISETYNDLLGMSPGDADPCVDLLGHKPRMAPDGTLVMSPCRRIVTDGLAPGSEARRTLVEEGIYQKLYNTNFTASWWLARGGVKIDASGNLKALTPGCEVSVVSRNSTVGPLPLHLLDQSTIPTNTVPLLGCGRPGSPLVQTVGPQQAGTLTVRPLTRGPVLNPTMTVPTFGSGTSREGPNGWWAVWTHNTLQDYRNFAPIHEGACNLLFADGSVRSVLDTDEDGLLNNGFVPTVDNGFSSHDVEIGEDELYSGWSLRERTY